MSLVQVILTSIFNGKWNCKPNSKSTFLFLFFIKHFEFGKTNYNSIHFGQLNRIFSRFIQLSFVMLIEHVKITYFFKSINHVEENFIKKRISQ